LIKVYI